MRPNKSCLILDDETYIYHDFRQLPGKSFYIAKYRFGVSSKFRRIAISKFPKKALVWQAICSCGKRSKSFITYGSMNGQIYLKECLKKRLLPFIQLHLKENPNQPIFWPDLASSHYCKDVMKWYKENDVNIIPKFANPANTPGLRPIERYWAIIKGHLRKSGKIAKSDKQFKKMWQNASKKVSDGAVQRMMGNVQKKVGKFAKYGSEMI